MKSSSPIIEAQRTTTLLHSCEFANVQRIRSIYGTGVGTTMDMKQECSKPVLGKLKIPPSPILIRSTSKCQVCTADGATLHYGGVVCGGCKIFFARAVQRRIYYVCEKSGTCQMTSEVGKLKDMKVPNRPVSQPKEEKNVVPYFDLRALRCSKCEEIQNIKVPMLERLGEAEGVKSIARMFTDLERACDNEAYLSPVPGRYYCDLDVPLIQAMQNPYLVSERTPVCWRASRPLEDPEDVLKPSYCRLVLHYLEWLSAIEDFMVFDETQRIRLTTSHMIPTILLTLGFNTIKHESPNLLLCNSFFFSKKKFESMEYGLKVALLVDELETTIIAKLRELHSISEVVELCLVHIVALDIAGMRGQLTFDLHLREYL
ncbi:zinc finger, C4 type [Necator americanus]|uniref:Zinc finger, C4 type n=1 Tax=Necator americanus TaxID=51031 RepID=W2TTL3_NECAM|nr:zinc finger, C4 type [Necator americanus]ETN85128.1 zinc finger, C4 type [Necator americanus]